MMRTARKTLMRFIGPAGRRGLTLTECMLALVILPLAVTAIAYAITAGQTQSAEALRQERAAMLAEALMEEILAKPYDDPGGVNNLGPESGETTRTLFDNMDDYNGYTEAPGALKDATGALYPSDFQRFGRSVTCSYTSITLSGLGSTTNGLSITVKVTDRGTDVITLTRFVARPS